MSGRPTPTPRNDGAQTAVLPRGVGLAVGGAVLLVVGVGFASAPLVLIAGTVVTAVAVAAAVIGAQVLATRSHVMRLSREVTPPTLSAGSPAEVVVRVETRSGIARRLRIREQAAAELTGGATTRASIARRSTGIELRYRLEPTRRGRWALGPALVRAADPFGLAWTDQPVGGSGLVAVWPAVVDLAASAGELMGAADRAHAGARIPAADDVALRDYRDGDDLRRVHWASSARRGTLVVRSEEQQGRTAATILLGIAPSQPGLEWAITAAASVALSVVEAGHPVRLIAGSALTSVQDTHGRAAEAARATLLDATLDLEPSDTHAEADKALMTSIGLVGHDRRDVVVAVIEPLGTAALRALSPLGDDGRAWVLVRTSLAARARGEHTVTALRAAGWCAVLSLEPEPLTDAWARLLAEGAT
ncbi:DUF58 domain-containing protein [Demequina mangrovi]|uniref:Uncharacterized conserved protein, DUF58 family, contains vWF domain n=1 Tax=Demequina mangrovi TaxID=1043493 RepID=A0A1H6Z0W3_9MICO|nr:DUF58 domain-containing protein [Demequina mangrovi]SEJ47163.1 Uncharacterized conserved protein, DUF58 family, contains vWF domain [Demequina mangrovi]